MTDRTRRAEMGRLTNIRTRLQPKGERVAFRPKRADRFYLSPEWRQLVRRIKDKRGNYCERCGADGRKERLIADHKVEVKDGGALLDEENVELLCHRKCNARKTAMARRARAEGKTLRSGSVRENG